MKINNNIKEKNSFWEKVVKKPVFMIVINVFILLFGYLSYNDIEHRPSPASRGNMVVIETESFNRLKPDIMAKSITKPIEKSLAIVKGIDYFTSQSTENRSRIFIYFKSNVDIEVKLNELRDIISQKYHGFPDNIKMPIIRRTDTSSESSLVVSVSIYSDLVPLEEVEDILKKTLKSSLKNIEGVGKVSCDGIGKKSIYIQYDPTKLGALGLLPKNIQNAIASVIESGQTNFGKVKSESKEFSVISKESIKNIEDIENILITSNIRLKDIATIKIKNKSSSIVFFNGKNKSIKINVYGSSGSNPLHISKKVIDEIKNFEKNNPNIKCYIEDELQETKEMFNIAKSSFFEACLLVILMVLLFLWSFGATIIPIVAIPISIIGTLIPMKLLGFSINSKTIAAFVMAIGLVVDDSMLFVEYILEKIKKKREIVESTVESLQELSFSIVVMTLTLSAVFVPIIFAPGEMGDSLREYAATLSIAVIFSGISSLTLTPIMCIKFLKNNVSKNHNKVIEKIKSYYYNSLSFFFKGRLFFIPLSIISFCSLTYYVVKKVPKEDEVSRCNDSFNLSSYSSGSHTKETKKKSEECIQNLIKILEKINVTVFFSVYIREGSLISLRGKLKPEFVSYGAKEQILKTINDNMFGRSFFLVDEKDKGTRIDFSIFGDVNYQQLQFVYKSLSDFLYQKKIIESFNGEVRSHYGKVLTFDANKVIRDKNNILHVVDTTKSLMTQPYLSTPLIYKSQKYKIFYFPIKEFKESFENVKNIPWKKDQEHNGKEKFFFINDYFKIEDSIIIDSEKHFNGKASLSGSCRLKNEVKIGDVVNLIRDFGKDLPAGISVDFTGDTREYEKNSETLLYLIILACFIILMVLAAQFESFGDSFLVFSSAPLALMGAMLCISYKNSLNRSSIVGIITVIGLITKHGVLFVQFANNIIREEGGGSDLNTKKNLILLSARERIIPVLMTSFCMIFGLIPLAISKKESMVELSEICTIVVFGLSFGTLMTIFLLPQFYYFFKFELKSYINMINDNSKNKK
jgi:multidrug efflux pump